MYQKKTKTEIKCFSIYLPQWIVHLGYLTVFESEIEVNFPNKRQTTLRQIKTKNIFGFLLMIFSRIKNNFQRILAIKASTSILYSHF